MKTDRVGAIRPWLIGACLAAALPLVPRIGEVAAELQRERRADARYAYGLDQLAAGRFSEAAQAFRDVITLVPAAADAHQSLAEAELRRGNPEAAIQAYRTLMRTYPYGYLSTLRREVGLIELRAGRVREAQHDLLQAVTLAPTDWYAWYLLGVAQERLGNTREARAAWKRVLILTPDFHPARERLERSGGSSP